MTQSTINQHPMAWFVTSLTDYNNGELNGRWLDAAQLQVVDLQRDPHINPHGWDEQELFVTDTEYTPELLTGEYISLPWLKRLIDAVPMLFETDWVELEGDALAARAFAYANFDSDDQVIEIADAIMDDLEVENYFADKAKAGALSPWSVTNMFGGLRYSETIHYLDSLGHFEDGELDDAVETLVQMMQQSLIESFEDEV